MLYDTSRVTITKWPYLLEVFLAQWNYQPKHFAGMAFIFDS